MRDSTNHVNWARRALPVVLSACTLLACAAPPPQPGAQATGSGESTAAVAAPSSNRSLVIALRVEPTTVSPKPFRQAGIEIGIVLRLFNAGLAINDEQDVPRPYLVEALPQLNTETWRV